MKRFLIIVVVLGGILLGLFAGWQYVLSPIDPTAPMQEFEVESGWSGNRIAAALADAGLVRSKEIVQLYFRLEELDRGLGEGLYDLSRAQSVPEIIAALQQPGRPRVVTLTFPEGWRASAVLERLRASGHWPSEALEAALETPETWTPAWFDPPETGLEGYLFPDTYHIPEKYRAEEALALFLNRFAAEMTPDLEAAVAEAGLSMHEWVILASMVQAEAANDAEMPIIAGVFLNRLALGMPLQSDPTAVYESGKPLNALTAADLRVPNPWNTYTEPGLPRGPINNPGSTALNAIVHAIREDEHGNEYLYFLHGTDNGEPVFKPNTSLAAHNRDIERYLR